MNLRSLSIGSLLLLVLAGCQHDVEEKAEAATAFQNVVVIIGDDHAAHAVGAYGNPHIRTPHIDRMAQRGVRFTQAYANAPLCSASRQSMLTGRYPHAAGVTLLRTSFPEAQVTIAEHLKDYNFETGVIGKTHFNNAGSHGFDTVIGRGQWQEALEENPPPPLADSLDTYGAWRPFVDPAAVWLNAAVKPLPLRDEDMEDTFYARAAADFLEANQQNRFLLWVGFHNPHSPFNFPVEYAGRFQPEAMTVPEGSPEDDRWIPQVFQSLTDEEKRGIMAAYYTSVEHMDKNVGLILDQIDALGLDDRTLVIYVGDQGYLLGHHKRFEKHMMWEEAIRSPLVVQAGGQYGQDRRSDVLTEFVDLTPTILDALAVDPLPSAQGQSLMPVLTGQTEQHKELVFSEFLVDNKAMVRNAQWKYIFTTGTRDLGQGYETGHPPPGITHRLYNLEADPGETTNVATRPENEAVLLELQQAMVALFRNTDPRAGAIPDSLTLEEQLTRFCIPPDEDAQIEAR